MDAGFSWLSFPELRGIPEELSYEADTPEDG